MNQELKILTSHISLLWVRLTEIYGHKFISSHGEADSGTWLKGLSDKEPEDIARGLAACLQREDAWPPSLPEFRELCKKPITPFDGETKRLPKPERTEQETEAGLDFLANMKKQTM